MQQQGMADRSSLGGARMPVHTGFDNFTSGHIKSAQSKRQAQTKWESQQGITLKQNKQNVISSLSLREDMKLHVTENTWRRDQIQQKNLSDDELYKTVNGILNGLTPQTFNTLVTLAQSLPIDSSDRLEGVIKLVFEKAVDEPSRSVMYAQMCKVLATVQFPAEKKMKDHPEELMNFRRLLVNRCQAEFERMLEVKLNRSAKLKEIEDTTDPEKKKDLQMILEEERKLTMKSVGSIRLIGELFKVGMLTTNIMHRCIRGLLLHDTDEEALEVLCVLLTTIGKDLEMMQQQNLSTYFQAMKAILIKDEGVSSHIRCLIYNVIELRQNKWNLLWDDSNPETLKQIQKKAEGDSQVTYHVPLSWRNRQGAGKVGWSVASSRRYIDTTKLKPRKEVRLGTPGEFSSWVTGASVRKDPKQARDTGGGGVNPYGNNYFTVLQDSSADDSKRPPLSLSRSPPKASMEKYRTSAAHTSGPENKQPSKTSVFRGNHEPSLQTPDNISQPPSISASAEDASTVPGRSGANSPIAPLGEQEIINQTRTLLDEFINNNDNLKKSEMMVAETFAQENLCDFVRESLNSSVEKSSSILQNAGTLLSHLVKCGVISLSQYLTGLTEYLDNTKNLGRDTSKVLLYTAEMLVPMFSSEAVPLCMLLDIASPSQDGQMICEVLHLLNKTHGPAWVHEKWVAAGLKWSDFLPEDRIDSFVKENKLMFTIEALPTSSTDVINWNSLQKKLCQIVSPKKAFFATFDIICDWINANVGSHTKEPEFIRALATAVCQSSISAENVLNKNHFAQQQRLLVKYIDNQEHLELQCLYAIQALMNQMQYPQGLLCQIVQSLCDNSTICTKTFIEWQCSTDPAGQPGKEMASKTVASFYTVPKLDEEDSSCEQT